MDNVTTQNLDEIVISLENTAKTKNFVTYDDINNALSLSRVTPEDIEYILAALAAKNIEIRKSDEVPPSADLGDKINNEVKKLIAAGETERAEACTPTGIPFLDLAVLKGRFPSTMARFCTQKLKIEVIIKEFSKYLREGFDVKDWVGIRADESTRRAKMPEMELFLTDDQTGCEAWHYRPILKWTANDCFEMMKRHGVEPNPLYKEGFSRVGCFPCISCRKEELRIIAEKYPGVIDRLNDWEVKVGRASKRGGRSTFFTITSTNKTIYDFAEWAKTARGGKQYQLDLDDLTACKSVYGLCE